jgi:hypothetical protein
LQSQFQIYTDQILDAKNLSVIVISFGFSAGDFVAGAQLACTFCQALTDPKAQLKNIKSSLRSST